MSEHIVDKEKMDAFKALADTNMKISEAKGILFKLQETETEYLEAREKKVLERIQKVVEESQELVNEAKENYQEMVELGRLTSDFSKSLVALHDLYRKAFTGFEERNILWEKQIGEEQDALIELRKGMKVEKMQIDNDKKSLEKAKTAHAEEDKRIRDKWGEIERTITRLKEGRI